MVRHKKRIKGCGIIGFLVFLTFIIIVLTLIVLYLSLKDTDWFQNKFKPKSKKVVETKIKEIKTTIPAAKKKIRDEIKKIIPPQKTVKSTKKSPQKKTINVYFTKYLDNEDKIFVTYVTRKIDYTDEVLTTAIENLLSGPNSSEEAKGFGSSIPGGVKLLSVKIKNKTAYLNFNSQIETGIGVSLLKSRLYQIVYTATQFENINQVQILINGKIKTKFGSENIDISKPLSRLPIKPVF